MNKKEFEEIIKQGAQSAESYLVALASGDETLAQIALSNFESVQLIIMTDVANNGPVKR